MTAAPIRLVLLFCVAIWGSTFVATKICLAYMDPVALVGTRFLIGLPILFAIVRWQRIPLAFSRREWMALALGAAILTVHFVLQAVALRYTSATNTGWIIAATPLALAALSWALLHERLAANQVLGIVVATTGILLLVSRGRLGALQPLTSAGDWMILASAHTWALYTIATRDVARARDPLAVTLVVFTPAMLLCMAWTMSRTDVAALGTLPLRPVLALAFLGVLGTLTQWFWQIAVASLGAAKAGIYLYLEPVATTALAIPLLGERITVWTVLGGGLVISGVWWAERRG